MEGFTYFSQLVNFNISCIPTTSFSLNSRFHIDDSREGELIRLSILGIYIYSLVPLFCIFNMILAEHNKAVF